MRQDVCFLLHVLLLRARRLCNERLRQDDRERRDVQWRDRARCWRGAGQCLHVGIGWEHYAQRVGGLREPCAAATLAPALAAACATALAAAALTAALTAALAAALAAAALAAALAAATLAATVASATVTTATLAAALAAVALAAALTAAALAAATIAAPAIAVATATIAVAAAALALAAPCLEPVRLGRLPRRNRQPDSTHLHRAGHHRLRGTVLQSGRRALLALL